MGWGLRIYTDSQKEMKRFLPKSIAGQTIIVLLVGLTVSHIFSMTIYTADRAEVMTMSGGHQISHRVAAITRLLEGTPVEWRDRILQATNSQTLSVTVTPVSRLLGEDSQGIVNTLLRKYLARLIGTQDESRVVVQVLDMEDHSSTSAGEPFQSSGHATMAHMFHGQAGGRLLRASVRLNDGQWLNFSTAVPEGESLWSIKTVLSLLLMAVGVILISVWVIRRVTRPLRVFTAASQRLGKDVAAPPLVVSGSSELQEAVDAFNEMQQRLRRLVENRTRMLAAISHDLRTPITLLRLRAETVVDADERARMQGTLDEMEAMISSTLSFAREDAVDETVERVNLTALVGSICDDMTDTGYRVEFDGEGQLVHECRPGALKRALTNLIENAVKFGGSANVKLRKTDSAVEIVVEDDGPGIPEAELGLVFSAFYRVEKSRNPESGGVGLGLSVVQSVIDKHGGEIELSNRAEGGLRARIVLPL